MGFVSGTEAIYSFPSHSNPLPSPPHPHRRASLDLPGLIHRRAAWQVPGVTVCGPAGYNWRRGWRNQSPFRFPRSMQTTGGVPGDGGGGEGAAPRSLGVVGSLHRHHPACHVRGVHEIHGDDGCCDVELLLWAIQEAESPDPQQAARWVKFSHGEPISPQHHATSGGCARQHSVGSASTGGSPPLLSVSTTRWNV